MTIGAIVADATVSRATLYHRWKNKFELVVAARTTTSASSVTNADTREGDRHL
jgi:AcrR family transcriptional regulator